VPKTTEASKLFGGFSFSALNFLRAFSFGAAAKRA